MDSVTLAASLISAQIGRTQLEIAGKMLRMQTNHDQSINTMIEAAQHNIDSLSVLAGNLGGNVDISV
jgi:formylmethanofuran dehydrogenase subunit E